ncbi:HRDC domain-containing protein [candidate division KSB1 bacterium]|nr:HRDC domain-containing protein [candidate division KSB1 bacterium]
MQIKIFTIPVGDNGSAVEELNRFLRGNKIIQIENQFVSHANGAYWCFCVQYIEASGNQNYGKKKIDYKFILDEATFARFSKLREIRKKVAADEGIPAFAVFTDEELAGLAKLETITRKTMLTVKGIGDKKVERFAKYFITMEENHEAAGISD